MRWRDVSADAKCPWRGRERTQTELRAAGVRATIDVTSDPIKAKIANAETMKVHTMLVIGKRDLEESAMIDGCNHFTALVRIVLPLAAPGIAATAIFAFVVSWSELLFAISFTTQTDMSNPPASAMESAVMIVESRCCRRLRRMMRSNITTPPPASPG